MAEKAKMEVSQNFYLVKLCDDLLLRETVELSQTETTVIYKNLTW